MSGPERFVDWAQHWQYWLVRGVFVVAVLAEVLRPARARLFSLAWRWTTNVGLHFINGWALRIVAPYAVASWLTATLGPPQVSVLKPIEAWGGPWAVLVGAFVLLDLTTYFLHRLEHGVFVLWRLHSVHHADADVDATTAVRHHPFEVLFMGASLPLFMLVLGIPTWAFPAYAGPQLILALAQHANLRLPARVEAALGLFVMTPGLHRTHHASTPEYYNANFGAVLSVWDRWFGTLAPPLPERNAPSFGVPSFEAKQYARPHWALLMPFMLRRRPAAPLPAGEHSVRSG